MRSVQQTEYDGKSEEKIFGVRTFKAQSERMITTR